ncbi:MAG TPA: DnaJ domain-containing protein [Pyrinomonadaceae bacterium]|nr:DnaJ domain-containing protein [Pyrinomonadaceae bacterium]
MNGQLNKRPLAQVIREISTKSLSGRLSVEHDRIKVAAYFDKGKFIYAACNVRAFRLREYLQKSGAVSEQQLARFDEGASDFQLANKLIGWDVLTPEVLQQVQTRQVSDILRLASLWTAGAWDFDERAHLNEIINLNIEVDALLLEVEERIAGKPAEETETDLAPESVDGFLDRLRIAESYYDVLGVDTTASSDQMKAAYYDLARRYHPDRFRKAQPALLARLESAFARITQAYDTLRDEGLRGSYNSKLQARKKAQQLADSAPKPTTPVPTTPASTDASAGEPRISLAQRAENDFKEGYAALQEGQRKLATGLFASAARLVPNEPRYRAYYGQMLAADEQTRRAAETELQAAIKLDPQNAEYRIMLAQLFRDLGFAIRARGEAERALAADPNNQKARDLLRELKGD